MAAEAVFGPYRLIARLGAGGMGEVWRAVDTRKDREVAVKVLGGWLGADPGYAARFRREAALVSRLNAPNIIPIHDYGAIDGRLFMEMPLIEGTDLDTLIDRQGSLDPSQAVGIIEQVAEALDIAHDSGLVHRDIKPSNVLLTRRRGGGHFVYLIDFGIAHATDGTKITATGQQLGTLAYMPPERFDGGTDDARSDVYALTCVLFQALTGRPPFVPPPEGAHPLGFYVNAHLHRPPPAPSADNPTLPAGLDDVITRGMAKDPTQRYPSAGALAKAAHAALVTDPPPVDVQTPVTIPPANPSASPAENRTPATGAALSPTAPRTSGTHQPTALKSGPTTSAHDSRAARPTMRATPPPPSPPPSAPPTSQPRRPPTRRIAALVAGALVLLGLVGFAAYQLLITPTAAQVAVPNLVGQIQQDAANQIIAAGLRLGKITYRESSVDQLAKVLSSNPESGAQLDQRSTVDLIVGSGPESVIVPAVTGLTVPEATTLLNSQGLALGNAVSEPTDSSTLIGKIISSDPPPGERVKGGSGVIVMVGAPRSS